MLISVKTKHGRVAYTAARGGELIPTDRFVLVDDTPWIRRLIDYHEDIEVEGAKATDKPAKSDKSAPAA